MLSYLVLTLVILHFGFVPECDRYCGKRGSIMFHFGPNSNDTITKYLQLVYEKN